MEYKLELNNSSYKVNLLINDQSIDIEVNDELNKNNILVWKNLSARSLLKIQLLDSLINELPFKLVTAINVNKLNKLEENGYIVLTGLITLLTGLLENELGAIDTFDLFVHEFKNNLDIICKDLKKKKFNSVIIRKACLLCFNLQSAKFACHAYLHFAFGEFFAVQSTGKLFSDVNSELWHACFKYVPCYNLLDIFRQELEKNYF
jgi:hypothetical protein